MKLAPSDFQIIADIPFRVKYQFSDKPPAAVVARTLLAQQGLVERLPWTLGEIIRKQTLVEGQFLIQSASLAVGSINAGSLLEDVLARLAFGPPDQMNSTIDHLREKARVQAMIDFIKSHPGALALFLGCLVIVGIYSHLQKRDTPQTVLTMVEGEQNVVIQLTAQRLQIDPVNLERILEAGVGRRSTLERNAVDFVSPARLGGGRVSIESNGQEFVLPPAVIAATPESYKPTSFEWMEEIELDELEVRALDLDRREAGWIAVSPQLGGSRYKLEIAPGVDIRPIRPGRPVRAKVEVHYRTTNGRDRISHLVLVEILSSDGEPT